jgi:hypothetical protein
MTDSREKTPEAEREKAMSEIATLILEIRNLAHRGWEDRKNAEFLFREIGKRAQWIADFAAPRSTKIESMTLALEPCPDCGSRHHRSCELAVPAEKCNRCVIYHGNQHKTRTNGTWKDCGHPCHLGTSSCETCNLINALPITSRF